MTIHEILIKALLLVYNNFAYFLTIGSLCIAYKALKVTSKAFSEHNRPYITFNIEKDEDALNIYAVVRNNGIRGAERVKISISPPMFSHLLDKFKDVPNNINEITYEFIAPQQVVRNTFDYSLYRYLDNKDPENDIFKVEIEYWHLCDVYRDKYTIDLSYIKHLIGPADSDVKKGLETIHKDLEKIANSTSKIESKLTK